MVFILFLSYVLAQNVTEIGTELTTTEIPILSENHTLPVVENQTESTTDITSQNSTLPIIEFDRNLSLDELTQQINNLFNAINATTLPEVVTSNFTGRVTQKLINTVKLLRNNKFCI